MGGRTDRRRRDRDQERNTGQKRSTRYSSSSTQPRSDDAEMITRQPAASSPVLEPPQTRNPIVDSPSTYPGVDQNDSTSTGPTRLQFPDSVPTSFESRGYGPEAQSHIYRATKGTGTDPQNVPEPVLDVLSTPGQSLDGTVQQALEDRMDADFSNVQIHTGAKAAEAAEAIDARAFTCGNAIVFNAGEYDPESPEGQFLLAHELAHVQQQTDAPLSMMPKPDAELEIDPDPQLERAADDAAKEVLAGEEPLTVSRLGTEVHVQRVRKDRAETMQAILAGNVVADNPDHTDELEALSLSQDRKEAMDSQLEGVDPKTLVDPGRDSGISISLDNSRKETKYAFVKKAIEVLEEKEALAEKFERTDEQLEQAIADRNRLQNQLDRSGETGAQRRELQRQLKQKEAEIHELEGQLIRAHVELSKAVELAEALWEQVDVTELEGSYLDGEIEALQNELVSQWTADKVLGAIPGISEILSVLKDVREAGEKFLRIKRARARGVTIVEGEKETGMSDSTGDVDMEAEYEQ